MIKIPLTNGGHVIIDKENKKLIDKVSKKWYFCNSTQRVCARVDGQFMTLHTFLSPYPYTSFKNNNPRDCRVSNFKRSFNSRGNSKSNPRDNIYFDQKNKKYTTQRTVVEKGKRYTVKLTSHLSQFSEEECLKQIKEKREFLFSFSREEFIDYYHQREKRREGRKRIKNSSHNILEWSLYENRDYTLKDLGSDNNLGFSISDCA